MSDIRIMVVDDEPDFVELFVNRFRKRGLDVVGVHSGHEALEFLKDHDMDVVVLDVKMPGMDGIETLKEIKKRYPGVEVVMLTGHGSVESGLQGMAYGAYDYVMKPFKIEDLMSRIKKAKERRDISRGEQG